MAILRSTSSRKIFLQWNWAFWSQWIVLTTLGWLAAVWTLDKAYGFFFTRFPQFFQQSGKPFILGLVGLLFGMIVAYPQSFLLRKKLGVPHGWIRANALACAIVWALPATMDPILRKIAIGGIIGLFQWLVLRRKFPGHSWWILAGGLSWYAAEFLSHWLLQLSMLSSLAWNKEWFGVGIHGFLYALLTGFGICYLLYYTLFISKRARLRTAVPPRAWIFALSWIVVHGIAWAVAYGQIGQRVQNYLINGAGLPSHVVLEKAIFECLVALVIFPVLWRQQFRNSAWWIVWNVIGAAAGIFAWMALKLENASGIVAYGAIVGFFQWFVLSQKCRFFLLWLPIRTLSWAGALVLAAKIGARFTVEAGWGVGGIAYGVITGAFFYWQLRRKAVRQFQIGVAN